MIEYQIMIMQYRSFNGSGVHIHNVIMADIDFTVKHQEHETYPNVRLHADLYIKI